MIDVLIVEDSQSARMNIKNILETDSSIRVIGMAENGLEALSFIEKRKPDVITMDINMPKMNGFEATRRIMETVPVPIVVVSASYDRTDVRKSFLAMEAGAVWIIEKPFGQGHPDYETGSRELIETVRIMSEVRVVKRWPKTRPSGLSSGPLLEIKTHPQKDFRLVAIGASTGGPPVLHTVLSGLDPMINVPVVVVQHIAAGFLEGMVEWLQQSTPMPIRIASHGEKLMPGHIYFAPDDWHLGIGSNEKLLLSKGAIENGTRPSVSYMFRSAVNIFGGDIIGVLLSGMGRDGAKEMKMMRERGAVTIVQDKESSVVYGMPGEAVKLNAAAYVLAPEKMPAAIKTLTGRDLS